MRLPGRDCTDGSSRHDGPDTTADPRRYNRTSTGRASRPPELAFRSASNPQFSFSDQSGTCPRLIGVLKIR